MHLTSQASVDFSYTTLGSVAVFTPLNQAAYNWASSLPPGLAPKLGGSLLIEAERARELLNMMATDGLTSCNEPAH